MSKYISVNELDNFVLHDASFTAIYENDNSLIWVLEYVNVKKENSQNSFNCDMQIGLARISFFDYKLSNFDFSARQVYNENFILIEEILAAPVPKSEYDKHFISFVEDGGNIKGHHSAKN